MGTKQDREPEAIDRRRADPALPAAGGHRRAARLPARVRASRCGTRLRLALAGAPRAGAIDVVHACNPPDLLFLVALVLRPVGARFVFDQHDLVPGAVPVPVRRRRRACCTGSTRLLERITFAVADAVISHQRELPARRDRRAAARRPERVVGRAQRPRPDRFVAADPGSRAAPGQGAPRRLPRGDGAAGRRRLRAAGARPPAPRARARRRALRSSWAAATPSTTWSRWPASSASPTCVEFTGRVPDEFVQTLPVDGRRVPLAGPEEPAQRRVDDEQGRGVHGDGAAARVVRSGRGAGLGGRGRRLRAGERRGRVRRGDRRAARRSRATPRDGRASGAQRVERSCRGTPPSATWSRSTTVSWAGAVVTTPAPP